ncbi:MAG: hypothetical protein ACRD9L_26110, partial [Bryobacteraceae bacterium]
QLAAFRPGRQVSLLVARRDQLVRVAVTLGGEPDDPWNLDIDPASTPDQSEHRHAWLESGLLSREERGAAGKAHNAGRIH